MVFADCSMLEKFMSRFFSPVSQRRVRMRLAESLPTFLTETVAISVVTKIVEKIEIAAISVFLDFIECNCYPSLCI